MEIEKSFEEFVEEKIRVLPDIIAGIECCYDKRSCSGCPFRTEDIGSNRTLCLNKLTEKNIKELKELLKLFRKIKDQIEINNFLKNIGEIK